MRLKRLLTFTISSLGLAYFSNWATDTGKEFLEHFMHMSPLSALSLIILMDKTPAITKQVSREMTCYLKINKTGPMKVLKEYLIAGLLALETAGNMALHTTLKESSRAEKFHRGTQVKLCGLKRCFCS